MNAKTLVAISIIAVVASVLVTLYVLNVNQPTTTTISSTPINLKYKPEGPPRYFPQFELFDVYVYESDVWGFIEDGTPIYNHVQFELKQENFELYEKLSVPIDQSVVVIAPIFTITAYGSPGFDDYYKGRCDDSCIKSIPIRYELPPLFTSSANSIKILTLLGYPFLTDIEIDRYPEILENFDKVIVLHNEYVTKTEFEAISNHQKVIYLYPGALYAEIEADYEKDTITLIRGHGYPDKEVENGFDWKFDNSDLRYNTNCDDWKFYEIENGVMLNCYPNQLIYQNSTLLKFIKEY